jgi:hypothetical protein
MQYALELEYPNGVASSGTVSEPTQCEHVSKTIKWSNSQTFYECCH